MKVLFISGCYPENYYDALQRASKLPLQNAANTFQWAVINGLVENEVDVTVACSPFVASFPLRYKKIKTPHGPFLYQSRPIGECLSSTTLLGFKERSKARSLYKYAKNWCLKNCNEDKLLVITYTPLSFFVEPIIKLKKNFKQIELVTIITDLIEDANNFALNRNFFKRISISIEKCKEHTAFHYIDKYILLTKAMIERIPEAIGKNIIIEGIYLPSQTPVDYKKVEQSIKTILYTGSLQKFAGIIELVDAFMKLNDPDYRLIICGIGECEDYIRDKGRIDNRIIYKGNLPRQEVLELQITSTLLINPRRPDNTITKYSFPSKTMEYLASGTPMIGYKLQGIPEEYYQYYYIIDDTADDGLFNTMKKCMQLSFNELNDKGKLAREFILSSKTAKQQVAKILQFVNN